MLLNEYVALGVLGSLAAAASGFILKIIFDVSVESPSEMSYRRFANRFKRHRDENFQERDKRLLNIGFDPVATGAQSAVHFGEMEDTPVAIKRYLKTPLFNAPEESFMLEAQMLSALSHPRVIRFYGIVNEPGFQGVVLERMSQGSLKDNGARIAKDDRKVLSIAIEISEAMAYLHSLDIVHCDIIASNILLDDNDHAKLGDFGIARVIRMNGYAVPHGFCMAYMPIEMQVVGARYYHASDVFVYSLTFNGVVVNFQGPRWSDPIKLTRIRPSLEGFFRVLGDSCEYAISSRPTASCIVDRLKACSL